MIEARRPAACLLAASLALLSLPLSAGQQAPPQVPGTIRTQITMVPIDVRVLDAKGRPVTDLTQADFVVLENGREQKIEHFFSQGLAPDPDGADDGAPVRRADAPLRPQNRRVFLLLMGRGRMNGPVKELEALDEFLRTQLLPQDLVAFAGYNRATDFTTNHKAIAAVVARYKARHLKIESQLGQWFSGLRAVYGSKDIPKHIQAEIDAIFEEAHALRPREITPGQITDADRIREDTRRTADRLNRAEILAARPPGAPTLPDTEAEETADALDVSFDEYVERQTEQMQDLGNLYAGIEYLRRIEGEKHIAFVTPRGLLLPRAENDRSLASLAADARVAVDIIHTGGVVGAPPVTFTSVPGAGMRMNMQPVPSASSVFGQTFTIGALRRIADITGGQMTGFRSGREFFSRLDQSTRFQYLLGYYPADANWNGNFRNIQVRVNRPGVTVHYRRGYFASPQLVPVDRRAFLTFTRLTAAGRYTGEIADLRVTLAPPVVSGSGEAMVLDLAGSIDVSRVKFATEAGRHVASLDVGLYAGDDKQAVIGETLRKVDFSLTPQSYHALLKDGAPFQARIPIKGTPRFVKVIVYDYGSDLLGTAVVRMPKK